MPKKPTKRSRIKSGAETRGAGPPGGDGAPIPGPVKILFLDVDGTLTDGRIHFDGSGDGRSFWIRDGLALEWARQRGVLPVVISGRGSPAVERRMADLGLEAYLAEKDKVRVAERILEREGVSWEQCVMIGDDLPDVPLMLRVGWPIAVHDASPEVVRVAKTVTRAWGGKGAVREAVERVLRHNGTWDDVLASYQAR
jgi:3-deoxy-D-manno-octulosonate 8-phosphate phosphatase (KDO 8-P phosphatase)